MAHQKTQRVPSREAWGDLHDLDVRYAYKLFGGKTIAEAMPDFIRSPIERASELRFVPWDVFRYYIFCFAEFLVSDASKDESDCASCFLHLVLEKAKDAPQRLKEIYPRLQPAVEVVAGRQTFYEAPVDIYGSFTECQQAINAELGLAL